MNSENELKILYQKNLIDFPSYTDTNWKKDNFVAFTKAHIQYLLDHQFTQLVQIIYRIDVSEKEFALTLHPSNKRPVAESIAELIFDRLLLKAKIRAKYKNKNA
jgi:hypothetical protein